MMRLLGPYEDAMNESMLEAAANVKSQATTVTQEQVAEVTESEDNQTLVHESSANVYVSLSMKVGRGEVKHR